MRSRPCSRSVTSGPTSSSSGTVGGPRACRRASGRSALPENIGIPAGRNAGVPHVDGDLLLFLDDDAACPARRSWPRRFDGSRPIRGSGSCSREWTGRTD